MEVQGDKDSIIRIKKASRRDFKQIYYFEKVG